VVRRVLAAVCWVQQLSHEDQKHHKGKTRNFYLKFFSAFLPSFTYTSFVLFCFYQISWWGRKENMKLFFLVNSLEFLYKLQKQADAAKMVDVETEVTDDPDELQRYNHNNFFLGGRKF
jgi:hypothetical protein